MRINRTIRASVLPTVIVVCVLMLTSMLGLLTLWENELLQDARSTRLRQARADVESAYLLYQMHPGYTLSYNTAGLRLYDSLPSSTVRIDVRRWGLYELVAVSTSDSLICAHRIFGITPDTLQTLTYADNHSAVTLAGRTILQKRIEMPRNGIIYGRVDADFYNAPKIQHTAIGLAGETITLPLPEALRYIAALPSYSSSSTTALSDSLHCSFADSTRLCTIGQAQIGNCYLSGNMILHADELRIDSTCHMTHVLVCARKIIVTHGAHITAQLFARDTIIVEARARMEYPSGIYCDQYAEIGKQAEVNGYIIVRDTTHRNKIAANYRQSRSARVRGLVWIDGIAHIQGIISGQAHLRQAVYFSDQGYYKDMLYDLTLLTNPQTAFPVWLTTTARRKEAACVD